MKLPQSSVRDLFWLLLVVAMGLGWWRERQIIDAVREKGAKAIESAQRKEDQLNQDRRQLWAQHQQAADLRNRNRDVAFGRLIRQALDANPASPEEFKELTKEFRQLAEQFGLDPLVDPEGLPTRNRE